MKRSPLDNRDDSVIGGDSAATLSKNVKKAKTGHAAGMRSLADSGPPTATTAGAVTTVVNAAKVLKVTTDMMDMANMMEKKKKKQKKMKKVAGTAKSGHGGVGGLPKALKRLLGSAAELVVVGKSTKCSRFVSRGRYTGGSTASNATSSNTSSSAGGTCGVPGPTLHTCQDCGMTPLRHRLEVQARRTEDGGSPLFPLLRAARQVLYAAGCEGHAWCYSLVHALRTALAQEPGLDSALRAALGQAAGRAAEYLNQMGGGDDDEDEGGDRPDVLALCELDTVFFHLTYCDLGKNRLSMATVPDYFENCNASAELYARHEQTVTASSSSSSSPSSSSSSSLSVSRFCKLAEKLEPGAAPLLGHELGAFFPGTLQDDLCRYWRARVREGVRLFGTRARLRACGDEMDLVGMALLRAELEAEKMLAGPTKGGKGKKREHAAKEGASGTGRAPPPCYAALEAWRDDARDWACTLYAFAVPCAEAIALLCEERLGGLVEIGAGTGYWARLLRERGGDIAAYDKDIGSNEYHGDAPLQGHVLRGGVESLRDPANAHRCLFLCYPPPDTSMALDCLKAHTGAYVAHVGELCGDTGTPAFETRLWQGYTLETTILLPNFSNTSYSLTLWRRREFRSEAQGHALAPPAALAVCANPSCSVTVGLSRCRYCRHSASFCCSEACCAAALPGHRAAHLLQLNTFSDDIHLAFGRPCYEPLRLGRQFAHTFK